jgi:hypothetical protein
LSLSLRGSPLTRSGVRESNKPGFPIDAARGNRLAKAERLDFDPGLRKVVQIGNRYRRDLKTFLRLRNDETFRRQSRQCFSNCAETNAKKRTKVVYLEQFCRLKATSQDVRAQTKIGAFGPAFRCEQFREHRALPTRFYQ